MLAVVSTIKVRPGQEAAFEAVARELTVKVNAKEPGCKLYTVCKGVAPQTYVFLERYVDEEAAKTHRLSEHFRELGKKIDLLTQGAPQLLRLTEVS